MLHSSFCSEEFKPSWHSFHIGTRKCKACRNLLCSFLPFPSFCASVGLVNLCWCNGRCVQCLLVPARRQGSTPVFEVVLPHLTHLGQGQQSWPGETPAVNGRVCEMATGGRFNRRFRLFATKLISWMWLCLFRWTFACGKGLSGCNSQASLVHIER